jgi:threonine aldolase
MDDGELRALRASCDRFLTGHGLRTPEQIWAESATVLDPTSGDVYGSGGAVADLEEETAELLGKPAAIFMPTGTMAQQIALRIHAERTGRNVVLCHHLAHPLIHEDQAAERLHGLHLRPVGSPDRLMTIEDLDSVAEYAAALLIELPQREIGGQLPSWDDLVAQTELARSHGTALHLDGARLLETLPNFGRTAVEVATLFDTVYLSMYKGLGAMAGCVLAGEEQVIDEAREWRHRHGGTMYGMWPYAASALAALRLRAPRMPDYVAHAQAIAGALASVSGVRLVPEHPPTNMMHLHLDVPAEPFAASCHELAKTRGTWTWGSTRSSVVADRSVVEVTVGDATLEWQPAEVAHLVGRLIDET